VIDHDETRELDRERVRQALAEAGERDTGHSGERIEPSRDREARERLEEPPPADDRGQGEGGDPSGGPIPLGSLTGSLLAQPPARGSRPSRPRSPVRV
jgi:hypothetical protein